MDVETWNGRCQLCGDAFTGRGQRRKQYELCGRCRTQGTRFTWPRAVCNFCGKDVAVKLNGFTVAHSRPDPDYDCATLPCRSHLVKPDDPSLREPRRVPAYRIATSDPDLVREWDAIDAEGWPDA